MSEQGFTPTNFNETGEELPASFLSSELQGFFGVVALEGALEPEAFGD